MKRFDPGYDPYNSAERPLYTLVVTPPTQADRAARRAPPLVLILPAGLIAEFAPDEFDAPAPLGAGPLPPE